MRQLLLVVLLVVPGLLVLALSGYFALQDWHQLRLAYAHYHAVTAAGDMRALFIANAAQETHRVNLFADVVWALQGMAIFGLGLVGLCLLPSRRTT